MISVGHGVSPASLCTYCACCANLRASCAANPQRKNPQIAWGVRPMQIPLFKGRTSPRRTEATEFLDPGFLVLRTLAMLIGRARADGVL